MLTRLFSMACLMFSTKDRAPHPGEVMIHNGGTAFAARQDDSRVDNVCQHGAAEALKLERQRVKLLF